MQIIFVHNQANVSGWYKPVGRRNIDCNEFKEHEICCRENTTYSLLPKQNKVKTTNASITPLYKLAAKKLTLQ